MRRRPAQVLVLAVVLAVGALIGVAVLGRQVEQGGRARGIGAHPDIELRGATAAALAEAGFRLRGSEPRTWRDIDLRLHGDDGATRMFLACRIAPAEVDGLFAFAAGSVRPADDRPDPAWDGPGGPRPGWWRPSATRARSQEVREGGVATGLYAAYDPASERLWLWRWTRRGLPPPPPRPEGIDALVLALAEANSRVAPVAGEWLALREAPIRGLRADLALRSRARAHRAVLRLAPLDAAAAERLLADLPMRPLAADGPPPAWAFALPPALGVLDAGDGPSLPAWFAPGPGPRWGASVVRLGDGAVESARWAAHHGDALYVWDWADPTPAPADLDPLR
ncbi:MAG: hypothetical protein RLZZ127_725 [Planctomycetota bacterium]|jgi:hypothetical protein